MSFPRVPFRGAIDNDDFVSVLGNQWSSIGGTLTPSGFGATVLSDASTGTNTNAQGSLTGLCGSSAKAVSRISSLVRLGTFNHTPPPADAVGACYGIFIGYPNGATLLDPATATLPWLFFGRDLENGLWTLASANTDHNLGQVFTTADDPADDDPASGSIYRLQLEWNPATLTAQCYLNNNPLLAGSFDGDKYPNFESVVDSNFTIGVQSGAGTGGQVGADFAAFLIQLAF